MPKSAVNKFLEERGKSIINEQKFLGYFHEIYDFYNGKLPDNKYIYYLDENPVTRPLTSMPPITRDFFQAGPLQLSLLVPQIRIFKSFKDKEGNALKKIEFPFENKMDFEPFKDPRAFFKRPMPFVTETFKGSVVAITNLSVSFEGVAGVGGAPGNEQVVFVDLEIRFQDAKMLFKSLNDKYSITYKDLFAVAQPNVDILLELGYNQPANYSSKLSKMANAKLLIRLDPIGANTTFTYGEDGSLLLKTTLGGRSEKHATSINLFNPNYYTALKERIGMQEILDQPKFSSDILKKKRARLLALQNELRRPNPKKKKSKAGAQAEKKKSELAILQDEINLLEKKANLATSLGAITSMFPFVAILQALEKIYYVEMNPKAYATYMTRISKGLIPFDQESANDIKPTPNKKIEEEKEDLINLVNEGSSTEVSFKIGDLSVKQLVPRGDFNPKTEKIKYFYLGDLLNIILNDQDSGGIGQELNKMLNPYCLLLGPALFVKNETTYLLYNIANTPISVDMFLDEINKLLVDKKRKFFSLREFLSNFLKKFFDLLVFQAEKDKSGKNRQYYSGEKTILLNISKNHIKENGRVIKSFSKHQMRRGTKNFKEFFLIKTVPIRIRPGTSQKKSIPVLFLGGPDVGPLISIKYSPTTGLMMAEQEYVKTGVGNTGTSESVGETIDDSVLVSNLMSVEVELKGNPFYNLGDLMKIDSRFVDGGYFTEKKSALFFTGLFQINKIVHSLKGNQWTSKYSAVWAQQENEKTTISQPVTVIPPNTQQALHNALSAGPQPPTGDSKTSPSGKPQTGGSSGVVEKGDTDPTPLSAG